LILKKEPYDQYKHLVMVCDDNTYEAAGKEVDCMIAVESSQMHQ